MTRSEQPMTKADYDELVRERAEKAEAISVLLVLVGFIVGLSTGNLMSALCVFTGASVAGLVIQYIAAAIAEYERAQEGK